MKKLMKLGTIATETRNNDSGNKPDGGARRVVLGKCIRPQTFDPLVGNTTFTLTTQGC